MLRLFTASGYSIEPFIAHLRPLILWPFMAYSANKASPGGTSCWQVRTLPTNLAPVVPAL